MPRTRSALVESSRKRETIAQFFITGEERARDGHINPWARTAREVVNEYLKRVAEDPRCTLVLTLESEPGPVEQAS